jgi:hypothetical protein
VIVDVCVDPGIDFNGIGPYTCNTAYIYLFDTNKDPNTYSFSIAPNPLSPTNSTPAILYIGSDGVYSFRGFIETIPAYAVVDITNTSVVAEGSFVAVSSNKTYDTHAFFSASAPQTLIVYRIGLCTVTRQKWVTLAGDPLTDSGLIIAITVTALASYLLWTMILLFSRTYRNHTSSGVSAKVPEAEAEGPLLGKWIP